MKISQLINNPEFSFNVKYKICRYEPSNGEEGEVVLIFDSEKDSDISFDLCSKNISAINQAEDGTVEIEYIRGMYE